MKLSYSLLSGFFALSNILWESRGGLGTKAYTIVVAFGNSVCLLLIADKTLEFTQTESLLEGLKVN